MNEFKDWSKEELAALKRGRESLARGGRTIESLETEGRSMLSGEIEPLLCGLPFTDAISMMGIIKRRGPNFYVSPNKAIPESENWEVKEDCMEERANLVRDTVMCNRISFVNVNGKWRMDYRSKQKVKPFKCGGRQAKNAADLAQDIINA